MKTMMKRGITLALPLALVFGATIAAPSQAADTEITWLVDNGQASQDAGRALIAAYEKANPGNKVTLVLRPGGTDGDNLVKTKLATGSMEDVFTYNSGSLFQALAPSKNLLEMTSQPFMKNVLSGFYPVVSVGKKIYGTPFGTAVGGGILYNKKVYAKLGLKVPLTWADFMANNKKIKAAGIDPVIQSYKETWTSQLFVLADYYNVQAASPNFAADYTNNKEKYAKNKTALRGFEYIEELKKLNYFNRDYASTTYAQALDKLALGQGAHYPMATWAIPQIASQQPANLEDVGFFAQPGPKASVNGVTVWVPSGTYITAATKNAAAAVKFVGWMTSAKAVDVMNGVEGFAGGPYYIKGASIPNALPGAVKDVVQYFTKNATAPALEFVSPIKGPNLEKILVEVGLGITTAKKAAAAYDADVVKQAKQLGIKGW
jgi:raffinose/stachyose/melibiose transport system substrate-binding protein